MASVDDIPISPRQLELLALTASGKTIKEAAEVMCIVPRSAYNMMVSAKRSAGCATVEQMVVLALNNNWIAVDDQGYVTPVVNS